MNRPFHGGDLKKASLKYRLPRDEIIDFSANINPLGLSSRVREALLKNIDLAISYPDPYCNELKREIASYLGIQKENILVGNGSCDLIYLIVRSFYPRKALVFIPTFSEYEYAVKTSGGICQFSKLLEEKGFIWEKKTALQYLKGIDLVFICNPNNPTGTITPKEDIFSFVDTCKKHKTKVMIDEAFIDFVKNHDQITLVKEAPYNENLLVLRSLTKFFSLAGLRVGYLVGEKRVIKELEKNLCPWSVNGLGQIAAKEALKDQDFIEKTKSYIEQEKGFLWKKLKEIKGIKPYPAAANFIFCRLTESSIDSSLLTERLGRQGIFIRDCSTFKGLDNKFIRIAVRKREENIKLIAALKDVFGE
jgi:threonine-phosphate decarboxylase